MKNAILPALLFLFSFTGSAQVTYTVINNADAGAGSLRAAIAAANGTAGLDNIVFAIAGPTLITPVTPLPQITDPVSIQGYSQAGSAQGAIGGARLLVLDIDLATNAIANGLDFAATAGGSDVSGLAISGATNANILVQPGLGGLHIWGCHIGTNLAGNALGYGGGIGAAGILLGDGTTAVTGVSVGTNADNVNDANEGNVVGGVGIAPGFGHGVRLNNADGSRIAGNYLGLAFDGATAVGNGYAGVYLLNGSSTNIIGVDDASASAAANQNNYIGFNRTGIALFQNSNTNTIAGNYIGVNPAGAAAGNTGIASDFGHGVMIIGSSDNLVGTDADGDQDGDEANTIGFNGGDGVIIRSYSPGAAPYPTTANLNPSNNNRVQGNLIGTGLVGVADKGNGDIGVVIAATDGLTTSGNIVGSDGVGANAVAEGNTIQFNDFGGIAIAPIGTGGIIQNNRVSANTIVDNSPFFATAPPITLNFQYALTPNDDGDADAGPNDLLNRPVIESVTIDATNVYVVGWAGAGQTLDLYATATPSGPGTISNTTPPGGVNTLPFGYLQTYLISVTEGSGSDLDATTSVATDDGTGFVGTTAVNRFSFTIPLASLAAPFAAGDDLAAVALSAATGAANASEASAAVTAASIATTFVVTNVLDAGPGSLRAALTAAGANANAPLVDNITFAIPGPGPFVIAPATPLPGVTEPLVIEGYTQPGSVQGPIGTRAIAVNIDFTGIGAASGFVVSSTGVEISGLAMSGAAVANIVYAGAGITSGHVWGNYIGSDLAGAAIGFGGGVSLAGVAIGDGVTQVSGIAVGTNADGTDDDDEGNVVGGIGTATFGNGVLLNNATTCRVAGNYIGIASGGAAALGNGFAGINIQGASVNNIIGYDDAAAAAVADQNNYVGFNLSGIALFQNSTDNTVAGNYVGVNPAGGSAGNTGLASTHGGIIMIGASSNNIGTDGDGVNDASEANTIGFNAGIGVLIRAWDGGVAPYPGANGFDASDNRVMGNLIGTGLVGAADKGNGDIGVVISATDDLNAQNNIIGSDGAGANGAAEANTIQNNEFGGVAIAPIGASTGLINQNRVSQNSFDNNFPGFLATQPSILHNFTLSPTPNDAGDADAGPNNYLNRPIINTVTFATPSPATGSGTLTIDGWAPAGATIEFYRTSGTAGSATKFNKVTLGTDPNASPLAFGELETFLASATVPAGTPAVYPDDGTGESHSENNFALSISIAAGLLAAGDEILAVVIDAAGNTSEPSTVNLNALILPVTFLNFTGVADKNVVNLAWQTGSEQNSSYFDVERSADGNSFSKIGVVNARGNSSVTSSYQFTDQNPLASSVVYYRLRQVDLDGRFMYSNVILVKSNGSRKAFSIAPNPISTSVTISMVAEEAETMSIRFVDQSGKSVRSYRQAVVRGANLIKLTDLGSLPRGVYVVQITGKNTLINEKILKY